MNREQQGVVLFLALLLSFFFFLTSPPEPRREPLAAPAQGARLAHAAPGGEFTVEVDGGVQRRGLYTVAAGQTVLEVIEKAGGVKERIVLPPEGLRSKIENNCRLSVIADGEGKGRILIEPLAPKKLPVLSIPVNINTAGVAELDTLPGIGPQTAQAIIEHRETQGKFAAPEDLLQVRGIGPKKFAALRPHITAKP